LAASFDRLVFQNGKEYGSFNSKNIQWQYCSDIARWEVNLKSVNQPKSTGLIEGW